MSMFDITGVEFALTAEEHAEFFRLMRKIAKFQKDSWAGESWPESDQRLMETLDFRAVTDSINELSKSLAKSIAVKQGDKS